ncbi:DUF2635 domain-containing protein [Pseudomonas veronii]|uniref:DUF2635 domain-containing protein n=1 Tax=Pseudomonas veronii TaxID=76761 RepID=A0A7Y1A4E8_PSEVE|nr:DUF2635 domain-containing protein [Pseudomonas veronii]NMY09032.1 DUF2635 domain-containing protein [Pseudomonas veronii]
MRIYPYPGLLVRDPVKRDALPEEGREVSDNDHYWLRRLACSDVTRTPPKAETSLESPPAGDEKPPLAETTKSETSQGSDS